MAYVNLDALFQRWQAYLVGLHSDATNNAYRKAVARILDATSAWLGTTLPDAAAVTTFLANMTPASRLVASTAWRSFATYVNPEYEARTYDKPRTAGQSTREPLAKVAALLIERAASLARSYELPLISRGAGPSICGLVLNLRWFGDSAEAQVAEMNKMHRACAFDITPDHEGGLRNALTKLASVRPPKIGEQLWPRISDAELLRIAQSCGWTWAIALQIYDQPRLGYFWGLTPEGAPTWAADAAAKAPLGASINRNFDHPEGAVLEMNAAANAEGYGAIVGDLDALQDKYVGPNSTLRESIRKLAVYTNFDEHPDDPIEAASGRRPTRKKRKGLLEGYLTAADAEREAAAEAAREQATNTSDAATSEQVAEMAARWGLRDSIIRGVLERDLADTNNEYGDACTSTLPQELRNKKWFPYKNTPLFKFIWRALVPGSRAGLPGNVPSDEDLLAMEDATGRRFSNLNLRWKVPPEERLRLYREARPQEPTPLARDIPDEMVETLRREIKKNAETIIFNTRLSSDRMYSNPMTCAESYDWRNTYTQALNYFGWNQMLLTAAQAGELERINHDLLLGGVPPLRWPRVPPSMTPEQIEESYAAWWGVHPNQHKVEHTDIDYVMPASDPPDMVGHVEWRARYYRTMHAAEKRVHYAKLWRKLQRQLAKKEGGRDPDRELSYILGLRLAAVRAGYLPELAASALATSDSVQGADTKAKILTADPFSRNVAFLANHQWDPPYLDKWLVLANGECVAHGEDLKSAVAAAEAKGYPFDPALVDEALRYEDDGVETGGRGIGDGVVCFKNAISREEVFAEKKAEREEAERAAAAMMS